MSAPKTKITPDWQEHFDFLLPRREFLRPGEVKKALSLDLKTIDALFAPDMRRSAPVLSGYALPPIRKGERTHKRIRRDSVILLLIERANTSPEEWRARVLEVLGKFGPHDLAFLHAAIAELIRRKA
ncbi:MAG: hypothetical protein H7067_07625 [Burkholderiales bacterium]|nr:hypothetical protein [Opitutaceae bacterium]